MTFSSEALIPHLAMAMDLAPNILASRMNLAFAWADAGCFNEVHELIKPGRPGGGALPVLAGADAAHL